VKGGTRETSVDRPRKGIGRGIWLTPRKEKIGKEKHHGYHSFRRKRKRKVVKQGAGCKSSTGANLSPWEKEKRGGTAQGV